MPHMIIKPLAGKGHVNCLTFRLPQCGERVRTNPILVIDPRTTNKHSSCDHLDADPVVTISVHVFLPPLL
jgi:hypothetical protein